ncbi:hypothetical protein GCM10020295_64520 [Streptomyces cinereospinus]
MLPGGLAQGGQVGDASVGGLRGAHRDQRGVRADGLGEALQRHGPHLEVAAHVEGVEDGGEVVLGGEDFGARGERGGDHAGVRGDRGTRRHPGGRHAGQPGERGASGLDVVEQRVQGAAVDPQPHRLVERGHGAGGSSPLLAVFR